MTDKKNQNNQQDKEDTKKVTVDPGTPTPSGDDNITGAINSGNPSSTAKTRSRRELHTKNTVLGSDDDGQAD